MRSMGTLCVALLAMAPVPAQAKVYTAKVNANSGPWSVAANPGLSYGGGDARPPTIVPIFGTVAGTQVRFEADGEVTYRAEGATVDANGDIRAPNTNGLDIYNNNLPSLFADRTGKGRATIGMLVGAFVNGDGVVIGKPFLVGSRATAIMPVGAVAVSLGLNDGEFKDNSGRLFVKIITAEPKVTVE